MSCVVSAWVTSVTGGCARSPPPRWSLPPFEPPSDLGQLRAAPSRSAMGCEVKMAQSEDFWELHRRLGECYDRDTTKCISPDLASLASLARLAPAADQAARKEVMPPVEAPPGLSAPGDRLLTEPNLLEPKSMPTRSQSCRSQSLWESPAFQADLQRCLQLQHSKRSDAGPSTDTSGDTSLDVLLHPRVFWCEPEDGQDSINPQQFLRVQGITSLRSLSNAMSQVAKHHLAEQKQTAKLLRVRLFRWLQHPGSSFRFWWDSMGMVLLCYDLIVLPLKAFNIGRPFFLTPVFWISLLYWTACIPLCFIAGYADTRGLLVLNLQRTIPRYARGWFIFDLVLISFDWIILATDDYMDAASGAELRLLRTLGRLRFLRLLRVGRMAWTVGSVMQSVKDQLSSRMSNIQYGIVRIVFQLLLSNHIIACLWFLLGSEENPDSTWVEQMQLKSKPAEFQYTTSLYWAFSQLGVGQTEIEAVNLHERIFSIVISFLALINFSTMVSSMTSLLESLRKLKDEETEQFSLLRRYLASNSIDPDLSLRITSFLQHSFSLKKKATSKDGELPILGMLSKSLREELQLQRHLECLQNHAFLGLLLESEDYNTRRVLCKMATQLQHSVLALDDVVFSAQSMANSCFYVAEGNCSYEQQDLAPLMLCGTWAAEMCLWTPWIHTGHLVSKDISRLITLEVTSFCECISRDRGVWSLAANYAQRFVGELNEEGHWSDLSPEYLQAAYLHESVGSQNSVRRKTCLCAKRTFKKVLPS
ncbi:unnamed protein product [Durusdinium trenchii]|uniref:Uncharacterized protein n=1 Tax=Durusdinium trenchii TaxID=1381693 RepID=A0ABP0JBV5_9DINO